MVGCPFLSGAARGDATTEAESAACVMPTWGVRRRWEPRGASETSPRPLTLVLTYSSCFLNLGGPERPSWANSEIGKHQMRAQLLGLFVLLWVAQDQRGDGFHCSCSVSSQDPVSCSMWVTQRPALAAQGPQLLPQVIRL